MVRSTGKALKFASPVHKSQTSSFISWKKKGIKTLAGGIQYEVLKSGDGESPAATDTVKVHYTGKLIGGQVFDSSVQRGEPATFPLNRVISGWTQGLQLMVVGEKRRFWIPEELAYQGTRPPFGMLVFDVELISFE